MRMSSRRRLQIAMWTEGRRRSPRISALELNAGSNAQKFRRRNSTSHGPSSFGTRARKKRKLTTLQYVSADQDPKSTDEQDSKQLGHEDYDGDSDLPVVQDEDNRKCQKEASNPEQTAGMPSELWLPEKRILELILDTLQRRDTHEIFAEPVDPDKVEDYYDIIEEPMDFGTMRAKLHEDMYRNLAQFEHDVLLITKNAMHFNSSRTVYFRQARAIDDLAKKVFHVLKTDPENFEFEFSKTRRSARRPQVDSNPSFRSSYTKVATNARSSNDAASRTVNSSMSPSNSTRRGNSHNSATHFQTKDHDLVFGARDGKTSSFSEVDRRLSYRSLTSASLDESNSIGFSSYIDFKTLLHVNQKDISYRESLMKFVKDLGPTAKLVAQRKLAGASNCQSPRPQCWFQQTHEHQNKETSSSAQGRPPILNTATSSLLSENVPDQLRLHGHATLLRNSDHKMDICDADKRGKGCTVEDMDDSDVEIIEVLPSQDKRSIPSVFAGKVSNSNGMNAIDVPRKNRIQRDQNAGKMLSFADFRCLNGSVPKLQKAGHESTILKGKDKLHNQPQSLDATSDKSRLSNALDYRVNDNINILSSSWPLQTAGISSFCQSNNLVHNQSMNYSKYDDQSTTANNRIHGVGCSAEVGDASKLTHPQQAPSQFIYNLSYLKSRLDQSRFSQQGSSSIKEQTLIPHNGDHQLSLLNPQHTELPLRILR